MQFTFDMCGSLSSRYDESVSSEFQSATENQALKDLIVRRIAERGGISFREFMEIALYEPRLGYYCSPGEKLGRAGDYMTSPELSAVFGGLVGRQLREMWQEMGRPATFDIVEGGGGSGALARDVLWWARNSAPALYKAIQYTIVERSDVNIAVQRSALADEGGVSWTYILPEKVDGCIVSNELLDAFPVHRVRVANGELREFFVDYREGAFVEDLRAPSAEVTAYFDALGVSPGEGCTAEVNLEAREWMSLAGRALKRGFILTFDYGYEAAELYAPWRTDGSLLCFYRHNPSSDPYARIGRQDMTSHVDFTSVMAAGRDAGLTTLGFTTQSEFLELLGIRDALAMLPEGTELEEYYARRGQISELLDPAGLGRIKVLVQAKGVGEVRLMGLEGEHDD